MIKTDHVIVRDLEVGDIVIVKTKKHEYRLRVVKPNFAEVEVTSENNPFVKKPTLMYVLYSLATKKTKNVQGDITSPGIKVNYRLIMDKLATTEIKHISLEEK